jgi:hypothetical protein
VLFIRGLKYGESDLNLLDVATDGSDTRQASPRPVMLFVAGDSFAGENAAPYTVTHTVASASALAAV